jgi:mediator of RNA polymerase II transcription subunit 23
LFYFQATADKTFLQFSLPPALRSHHEYLVKLATTSIDNPTDSLQKDFLVPILCNTFSTTQEVFPQSMACLVKAIGGHTEIPVSVVMPGSTTGSLTALGPTEPLSMEILDSLSVHAKMSLIHSIVTFIQKQVTAKSMHSLSPALVETYCRLLVYSEIETLGVKGFLNQLLPLVFRENAWGILHVLLEIFSYRLHHIQAHFRLNLLTHLQGGLVGGTHPMLAKNAQLSLCIESTALRLITGLGNSEISPGNKSASTGSTSTSSGLSGSVLGVSQLRQGGQQPGGPSGNVVLCGDSEELNRVVVLTLARAIHVNGLEQQLAPWVKDTLNSIMQKTPHSWPSHTLKNFPQIMQDFFKVRYV